MHIYMDHIYIHIWTIYILYIYIVYIYCIYIIVIRLPLDLGISHESTVILALAIHPLCGVGGVLAKLATIPKQCIGSMIKTYQHKVSKP